MLYGCQIQNTYYVLLHTKLWYAIFLKVNLSKLRILLKIKSGSKYSGLVKGFVMARVTSICRRRPQLSSGDLTSWQNTTNSFSVCCILHYSFLPYFALKKSLYPIAFDRCFFESLFCVVSCNLAESIAVNVQFAIEFDAKMGTNLDL